MQYIAIFIGGGLGSLIRFALSKFNSLHGLLPIGTMTANFLSCIVLGFMAALLASRSDIAPTIKAFFAVGFCGGFSTFSTFSLETFQLLKSGQTFWAAANIGISIGICLIALYIGMSLQKLF